MKRTIQLAAHFTLLAGLLLAAPGAQAEDLQVLTHPICETGNPISNNFGVADRCIWLRATIDYAGSNERNSVRHLPWVEFESDPNCEIAVTKGGRQSTIFLRDTNFSVLRFDDPYFEGDYYHTPFTLKVKAPRGCTVKLTTEERDKPRTGSFRKRAVVSPTLNGKTSSVRFELHFETARFVPNN